MPDLSTHVPHVQYRRYSEDEMRERAASFYEGLSDTTNQAPLDSVSTQHGDSSTA